jgi:hypothetical protein
VRWDAVVIFMPPLSLHTLLEEDVSSFIAKSTNEYVFGSSKTCN